jgi:DNA-binding winged helix-turn-helix (wHTH) protein/tetratricopeptide (TPR) repeat protein
MPSQALSRRICRFEQFEVDLSGGLLTRGGVRVKLQDQPFRILAMLLDQPGVIVSREQLRQELWSGGTYVDFDGSLNAALKRLRAALEDDPDKPRFIETVPKRGYRFIAPVIQETIEKDPSSSGAAEISAPSAEAALAKPGDLAATADTSSKNWILALAAITFLLIAAFAFYRWKNPARHDAPPAVAAMKPVPTRQSIAVLGFHNISGKPEDAWLATALSEMMSTELAAGDKLRIVSGEDVSNLRLSSPWSQTDTLGQVTTSRIGTSLNSDLLVLGSYASVGDHGSRQLRIDVRLQNAKTGEILTEVAEIGNDQNTFQLISRVGSRVRNLLGIAPVEDNQEPSVFAAIPANREAARFYSLGLGRSREFDYLAAVELLKQSIKADPNFPLSHSVLSGAWKNLGYGQNAIDEAKKALDLSANLSRTQKLLIEGQYYLTLGKMDDAASSFRALYAYYPDCLDCGIALSSAQIQGGRAQDAIATLQSLRRLPAPLSDDPRIDFNEQLAVSAHDRQKQYELLETTLRKAKDRGQNLLYARAKLSESSNFLMVGKPAESLAAAEEARSSFEKLGDSLGVARSLLMIAARQSDSGKPELALKTQQQALQIAHQLRDSDLTGQVLNGIGLTYGHLGRLDDATRTYPEARKAYQASGNRNGAAATVINLADVFAAEGKLRLAKDSFEASLKIDQEANPEHQCYALYSVASIELTMGDLKSAHEYMDRAMQTCPLQKVARYTAAALGVMGDILNAQANLPAARAKYEEQLAMFTKADAQDLLPMVKTNLALLALEQGRTTDAESSLRDLSAEFERKKDPGGQSWTLLSLSRALEKEGKLGEARTVFAQADKLNHADPDKVRDMNFVIQQARLLADDTSSPPNKTEAIVAMKARLETVLSAAKKMENYGLECQARLALGQLALQSNLKSPRAPLMVLAKESHDRGFELISREALRLASVTMSITPAPQ